jgi:hypothetical protein
MVFFVDRVIKEKGFYVYNMYNIVEEHFSTSIVPARSRGGSLVISIKEKQTLKTKENQEILYLV